MKYILALDQGTTSSRAVLFDENGVPVASHGVEFPQLYPKPGWVEHRPDDILQSQIKALRAAVEKSGVRIRDIMAVGITNQRETTLLWERDTLKPLYNAIVWQCRRTAPLIERLKRDGLGNMLRDRTGLIPDAYFSGTKLQWLLDTIPNARERAERGELCFGTVDTFLVSRLCAGHPHVTDVTNAARTMLYNIHERRWDEMLLRAMDIPAPVLPQVVDTSQVVGMLDKSILGREIPVAALVGDQQSALFGHGCFAPGMSKNTYGTGCFLLMNTGAHPVKSISNLITTIAWQIDGQPRYALEGSVFVAGAVVKWLRDEMGLISSAAESEEVAASIADNGNVYFVPAFTGLGAPHWDMYSRGTIVGLTRGTGRAHIVRAALESIAYQSADVLEAMSRDSSTRLNVLHVDGGASANDFLMQFQADILGTRVQRPAVIESTALGAAMLAGRAVGLWNDEDLRGLCKSDREFVPNMDEATRRHLLRQWRRAVEKSGGWEEA
ncbi:MAG TPA: glycerol kinase GlpK [Candidatus Pullichristensenella stercorigallinarum]|uniref:Glycerol kinase n=1 Tax=Candidatus Pullichristensenella stercorigallinarum TaxID=2840909 RepID=A0A9D0ZLM1_9FIRM|nr:glycerol kinase GlpK [Candidatus Pullichristensenella stercorigallinarum]